MINVRLEVKETYGFVRQLARALFRLEIDCLEGWSEKPEGLESA